jgi:hypothetical protein
MLDHGLTRIRKIHLAPRSGQRLTREARRVRGLAVRESSAAPHPDPLPASRGEGIGQDQALQLHDFSPDSTRSVL